MRVSIIDGDNFYEIRFASTASVIRVLHREGLEEFVRVQNITEANGVSSRSATLQGLKELVRRHAAHASSRREVGSPLAHINPAASFTSWMNTPTRALVARA